MTYRLVIEPTQKQQEWVNLTEQQLHYLRRVLRLKNGAHFLVMDGRGHVWNAILHENSAQLLDIITTSTELSIKLTLMVALPKGNGFEDILRSCTELGVNTFIPVISERTLLNPSPQKVERWRKIAIEAAEQSEREIIPQIFEPINFPTALTKIEEIETNKYICVTRREEVNHLFIHLQKPLLNSLVIATGPEGGWTNLEVQTAIKSGFKPVSLGRRILRAVTAPVYIASLVSAIGETHSMS